MDVLLFIPAVITALCLPPLLFALVRHLRPLPLPHPQAHPCLRVLAKNPTDGSFAVCMKEDSSVVWRVKAKAESGKWEPEEMVRRMAEQGEWVLTMQSGGEYAYFECKVGGKSWEVEVVDPAPGNVVARYSAKKKVIVRESGEEYRGKAKKEQPEWVRAIVEKRAEVDRVVARVEDDRFGFVISADSKWKDFPNGEFPYLQGFVQRPGLLTLRDLRGEDVEMLVEMKRRGIEYFVEHKDVDPKSVRVFFHYPPQFNWVHVHFCLINDNRADAAVERAHLLDDVVERLRDNSMFYRDANLTVVC